LITDAGILSDISVAPWGQEGPARLVHLPNGATWAWSSTNNRVGQSIVVGRPLVPLANGQWASAKACIILENFPATSLVVGWWAEQNSFVVAGSANLGHTTPCQIHVVPASTVRTSIPDPQPEPDPVDIPFVIDPDGVIPDTLPRMKGSATTVRGDILWLHKNGDYVNWGAWHDYDDKFIGLLADSSTGEMLPGGGPKSMYLKGPHVWLPRRAYTGWKDSYDTQFVWIDGAWAIVRVNVRTDVGHGMYNGVPVDLCHTYDPRSVDPKNPKRKAGFLEKTYSNDEEMVRWE
jgi:hypothetical protein